jgi:hypothetical protein
MICRNCQQPIEECTCGYGARFKLGNLIKKMESADKRIRQSILEVIFGMPLPKMESTDYEKRLN